MFDVVDISEPSKDEWRAQLENSDVIIFGWGNSFYLMNWVIKSGLIQILPALLKSKVYVGISAGSVIATPSLINANEEKSPVVDLFETVGDEGLGLVDFMIDPHVNKNGRTFEYVQLQAKKWPHPVYALDDNSAVKVNGDEVKVVSEGVWKKYN